jgi:MFS family permease
MLDNRVLFAFAAVFSSAGYGLLAPILPDVANQKHVPTEALGMIFATFPAVMSLSSPLVGRYVLPTLGLRRSLLIGMMWLGLSTAAFPVILLVHDVAPWVAVCVLLQAAQGFGSAVVETGLVALCIEEVGDDTNITTTMSWIEVFSAAGWMIGPPMAGFLSENAGFATPFLVFGGVALFFVPFFYLQAPPEPTTNNSKVEQLDKALVQATNFDVLRQRGVCVALSMVILSNSAYNFLAPTLRDHTKALIPSTSRLGLLFLTNCIAYFMALPFVTELASRHGPWLATISGLALIFLGFFLIGPTPLIPSLSISVNLLTFSMATIGAGQQLAFLPVMEIMTKTCGDAKIWTRTSLHLILSGLLHSAIPIGEILGSLGGTTMVHIFGFEQATTIWGLLMLLGAVHASMCYAYSVTHHSAEEVVPLLLKEENKRSQQISNNRCLSNGFKFPIEVKESTVAGIGVFVTTPVKCGQLVWEFHQDNVRVWDEARLRAHVASLEPQAAVELLEHVYGWNDSVIEHLDDCKFVNHATHNDKRRNIGNEPPHGPGDGYSSYAIRDIDAGEELLDNYTSYHTLPWFEELCVQYGARSCTSLGKALSSEVH